MSNRRCPHFSFREEVVYLAHLNEMQPIPVYECEIAGTIKTRFRSLPDGDVPHTALTGIRHVQLGPVRRHAPRRAGRKRVSQPLQQL
jgi:hypothetical protein